MTKKVIKTDEANASKSPGGRLILDAICSQASVISSHARALGDMNWMGYYFNGYSDPEEDDSEPCTDIPEAALELTSAMKDSVKNIASMVNMFFRAESAPAMMPMDGMSMGDMSSSESIVFESASGESRVIFTEAGTATVKQGKIRGTMIVAGFNAGKNRYYTQEALQEAVNAKMWDGKKMYMNHMSEDDKRNRPERSINEIAAVIKSTSYDPATKSIQYEAQLADPNMEGKLAYMQEHGILSAMGVSIHAAGSGSQQTIESVDTFVVEHFVEAYSTDFVTNAGAGGTIDMLESSPKAETPDTVETTGDNTMDEKTLEALKAMVTNVVSEAIKPIADAQSRTDARLAAVDAQNKAKTMIEASGLPDQAKTQLVKRFAETTTVDGVEEAITDMKALVESITPAAADKAKVETTEAKRVAKPSPVTGLGVDVNAEEGAPKNAKGTNDFVGSRASALFGGPEKTKALFESLR